MPNATFSVNGSTAVQVHATSYGATVTLALQDLVGVNQISWAIDGTSHSSMANPTITLGGSPAGSTATFAMPADPGDGQGRTATVRCTVTDSSGATDTKYRVVSVANARGYYPVAVSEQNYRSATHGWTEALNAAFYGVSSLPTLVNPTDDGKFAYGSAGAYTLTSTVKIVNAGASLSFGAAPASASAVNAICLSNTQAISARNFANSGNIGLLATTVGNRLLVGVSGTEPSNIQYHAAAAGVHEFYIGAGAEYQFSSTALLMFDNILSFGTAPATTGTIRLPNANTIAWRNFANSGNVVGFQVFTDNTLLLGDTANAGMRYNCGSGANHTFLVNGGSEIVIDANALYLRDNSLVLHTTNPAASGTIRSAHGFTLLTGRNNANSGDIGLIHFGITATDGLTIGSSAVSGGVYYGCATGSQHAWQINATTAATLSSTLLTLSSGVTVNFAGTSATGGLLNTGHGVSLWYGRNNAGAGNNQLLFYGTVNAVNDVILIGASTLAGGVALTAASTGSISMSVNSTARFTANNTGIGFYTTTPVAKPTVSGAKGGNAALGSLMTALSNLGLVTDSTTA
jgi:hypothetical protein